MREQRGAVGRIAETIAGTVRRRQRQRPPRVLLYDAGGSPRVVPPGADVHAEMVEVAERLIVLATGTAPDAADADAGDGRAPALDGDGDAPAPPLVGDEGPAA